MSSLNKLIHHIIFSTKYRNPSICGPFRNQLYTYMGGIIRSQNGHLIEIGGIEDHVHLLVHLSPTKAISDAIREIKAGSSKWSNECTEQSHRFEWQKGYGAFTVSYSQAETVRCYIQNQHEHHRTKTFQEEYLAFLKSHQIIYDEKYLFEEAHHG